ncbi:MAG TPA: cell division protein SepF [Bacillota bacterium]|nr:cell division protein SepF [Bacillota bacterium]HUM55826.1 cell division protein SepF [Bacillota bacterium]
MGVFSKFKDLVGIEEIDDDEFEEEIAESSAPLEKRPAETKSAYSRRDPKEKVMPMQSRTTNPFKLVVIEPEGFEECPKLVDSLKTRKPIIINLEKIESETARKIFDFLSGATYALNGNVQKVANNIFVFAPENVDISSSIENKGFDFNNIHSDSWR